MTYPIHILQSYKRLAYTGAYNMKVSKKSRTNRGLNISFCRAYNMNYLIHTILSEGWLI